jgi:hypothetical protein
MNTITKLSIWKNSLLPAAFILLEVSGVGPIAKYRVGECYPLFSGTGAPVFWLVVYTLVFLVCPIVDLLATILKPRVTVNNYRVPEQ